MFSLCAYSALHAPCTQALLSPCLSQPNSLQADGEQLKMRFFTKDQNNAVSTTAAGATDMRQAVAGSKHVAWGQVGSTSAPRDIARDSVEEKEGDKHVAWGRVGSTSAPRDIARDSVEEKEGNKQGAEADVAMGSTNHHGDNNRSLRGTH